MQIATRGADVSEESVKRQRARRGAALVACLAIAIAGVAWTGCGSSDDEKTQSSIEESFENSVDEAQKGVEKGVEEAKQGLKASEQEAKKSLEKAQEEAKKGIEKGKEEAKKGVEEVEDLKEKYSP
jgi:ribonucleotide reductase alpha subunit